MGELLSVLSWYVAIQLVGVAALPLTAGLLYRLPARGFAFARPFGLLLASYAIWIGCSLGPLSNRPATALVVVAVIALVAWTRRELVASLGTLLRERRRFVVATELLFLAAFFLWCVVRSAMPEIAATEKPMEFAFLNAALRADRFPPADPWLAGYPISYYYFGYVQAAILTHLSGVQASIAYNLTLATLFALTATGAFGLGYELIVALRRRQEEAEGSGPWIVGGLASLFTLALGNWEGLLEMLHARGFGDLVFWRAVGIKDLNHPFISPTGFPTDTVDNWWWFRAARVIATSTPDGRGLDYTINEFPAFSFTLGDVHPHVLALPFAFLALALALNVLRATESDWDWLAREQHAPRWLEWAMAFGPTAFAARWLVLAPVAGLRHATWRLLGLGLVVGGLGFLNAWDLPTYLFVVIVAFAISRSASGTAGASHGGQIIAFAWIGLALALLMYLPFYVGLRSQASGIAPVPIHSQLRHFAVFWGPLLTTVAAFLLVSLRRTPAAAGVRDRPRLAGVWPWAFGLSALSLLPSLPPVSAALASLGTALDPLAPGLPIHPLGEYLPRAVQMPALAVVIPLVAIAVATIGRMLRAAPSGDGRHPDATSVGARPSAPMNHEPVVPLEHAFVILLALTALLLVGGTEILFVRDLFNNRMNTVFKLYYQAWTLFAVAAAYGLWYLGTLARARAKGSSAGVRLAFAVALVALLPGFVYLPTAVLSRASVGASDRTLDGLGWFARSNRADYSAVSWLNANVAGSAVVVEASGGSYSQFGRVSANTGLPTILGWEFHEVQWRGNADAQPRRQADLDAIYRGNNPPAVLAALARYGASYVYVGGLEREKYGRGAERTLTDFAKFMDVAYQQDGVTIYRVRR